VTARRWAARSIVLVPVLLTGWITGYRMTGPQLWRDEVATWSAADRSLAELWRLAGTIDLVALPYYLFMHAWIGTFGDSVFALRLPSVLAMAGAAGVVTLLGGRLYGVRAGVLGGLLFAVVPSVSRYGQEARGYAFATLFAALATLLVTIAVDRPGRARIGYGVAVLLLGASHLIALLVLAGHATAVVVAYRRERARAMWWPVTVAVAVTPLVPLALLGLQQRAVQLEWLTAAGWRDLTTLPDQLFRAGIVGGAIIALAAVGMRPDGAGSRSAGGKMLWVSALAPVAVLYLFDQFVAPVFVGRYLVMIVPLLCVLAGATLAAPRLPLALVVVLGIGLTGLPQQQAVRRSHEASSTAMYDYRQVAAFLRANQRPGDGIVYAPRGGWHFSDVAMRYHLGDEAPRDVLVDRDAVRRGSLWATECPDPAACLAGTERVWVLSADDLVSGARARALNGTTQATRAALGAYAEAGEWRLSKFTLALYTR
jgi:mannosyltransferase